MVGDGRDGGAPGAVRSKVTADASVVAVTVVPALPVRSANEMLNATTPSESPAAMVVLAVHVLPAVLVTLAARPAIVALGAAIGSLAVSVSVTTSPTFAHAARALFDAIVTDENVGADLSKVTAEESVVEVTAVALFPARSATRC